MLNNAAFTLFSGNARYRAQKDLKLQRNPTRNKLAQLFKLADRPFVTVRQSKNLSDFSS
jgi:hypothetical protein